MFLKKLNLTNFRNYSNLELSFDSRPTILLGNNAAGKSNLLEAIYLLSITKSFRVEKEEELIKKDEEFAKVEGFLDDTELLIIINKLPRAESPQFSLSLQETAENPFSRVHLPAEDCNHLSIHPHFEKVGFSVSDYKPNKEVLFKKKVLVNGISRRTVDFIGNLPAVIFYPSDINMVTGSPSLRRWHLDLCLAQVDPYYKKALTLYEQFLTARNRVLKRIREGYARIDELDFWTEELVKNGKVLSDKRLAFFEFINGLPKSLGEFRFEYRQNTLSTDRLKETNSREVAVAATLIGPHRDDFSIFQKDQNLAHFGSRGEQRTATLAFKLAQLEFMAKIFGKRPILLLDDVFSELDASHRAHVVEIVGKQQTVIATVELENIPKAFLDSARILKVEDGKIIV